MLSVTNVIQVPKSLEFEYQEHFFFLLNYLSLQRHYHYKGSSGGDRTFCLVCSLPCPQGTSRLFILQGYLENLIQHHQVAWVKISEMNKYRECILKHWDARHPPCSKTLQQEAVCYEHNLHHTRIYPLETLSTRRLFPRCSQSCISRTDEIYTSYMAESR